MTAAVKIHEMSATQSGSDKTSGTVRFQMADDATVDNDNPITIPQSGDYTRSMSKQFRMYCATAPSVRLDNLRMYTDGSNGLGTGVDVFASNCLAQGGTFSANASADIGGADLFGFDSGTPFDMDAQFTASVHGTGYFGDMLKLQMRVASTASPGATNSETITFAYDEI